jgi:signal transduction histidine kinase/tetratricopeptide (TPR) repeat protein
MSIQAWLNPSRRLMIFFFALILGAAAGLFWLGWRLLAQDRALEIQRVAERREQAADRIVNALQEALLDIRNTLFDPSQVFEPATGDSAVIVLNTAEIEIHPPKGLLYQPIIPADPEPPTALYSAGEQYEFKQQDYARAIAEFGKLTRSPDAAVCAGAYLRTARNHRKAGDFDSALEAYEKLTQFKGIRFGGVPAELVGRRARCVLFSELGKSENLGREAQALFDDLWGGHWQITRAVFQLYLEQTRDWLASTEPRGMLRLALSAAVEWLWEQWQASQYEGVLLPNNTTHSENSHLFTILLYNSGESHIGLVAGPEFAEKHWVSPVRQTLETEGLNIYLRDSAGNVVGGKLPGESEQLSLRLQADTGLPWTVVVGSQPGSVDTSQFVARRRLILSGFVLVLVLFIASSYLIGRVINRELSIARLKSDFVSAVSHEFRTPLATLHQLTENLAEGRVSNDKRRLAYYQAQLRATGRLTRLVERLLDFGRMEAGALRYQPETTQLAELIRKVVDEFEHISASTKHQIEMTVDPDLPLVRVDQEAISQAIWNLLDNAIKYSPGRSKVWIEVTKEDQYVAVRVRDEGSGIPLDEQKNLFRKFVRGSTADLGDVKGTGIGLTMVDYIVRGHKGQILVDSKPGRGSTFTILLRMEGS